MSRVRRPCLQLTLRLLVGVAAACTMACQGAAGEACAKTSDCEAALECVIVEDANSYCVPRASERAARTCSDEVPCTGADMPLWPVEATCVEGFCACDSEAFGCDVIGDTSVDPADYVVDAATCLCRRRDDCDDEKCPEGLHCDIDGICR